jgi:pathogenesis-related protein 1
VPFDQFTPSCMSYFTKTLQRLGIITFTTLTPALTAWHTPPSVPTKDVWAPKVARSPAVYDVSTSTGIQQMVNAHNSWRKATGVAPLSWSPKLASFAQDWANTLVARNEFKHRANNNYGENLAAAQGKSFSPKSVVEYWGEEVRDYNYNTNSCKPGEMCGHYTQLVWHKTREVGCAKAKSGNKEVWVCNYNPPGNYVGQKPY